MEMVDVPGDERVRQRLFNKYKDSLRYSTLHVSCDIPQGYVKVIGIM